MPDLRLSEEAFPTTAGAAVEDIELAPDAEDEIVEADVEAVPAADAEVADEPQAAAEPEPETGPEAVADDEPVAAEAASPPDDDQAPENI
jgi:hypothetical protein